MPPSEEPVLPPSSHQGLKQYLRTLFDLRADADEAGTVESIKKSVDFTGANLWALVCAIFIASIGLNTNSTAVIIGAMLISPLMGPITGMGLALGTNDLELLKRSARNLAIAILISILTSTLYFFISPLQEVQSELLARTRPTIYDVLIATIGGLAGIIAGSRQSKINNAIPGVAIATALMPPLCTAGFGLATGRPSFFFGAFYLFSINSVFICFSTFLIVRFLRFRRVSFLNTERERRVKTYMALFAIGTLLPSIYTAWDVIQESVFESRARAFISESFTFSDSQVINSQFEYRAGKPLIKVTLIGEPLNANAQQQLRNRLAFHHIPEAELQLNQPRSGSEDLAKQFDTMNTQLRVGIVEDLYKKNEELLHKKNQELLTQAKEIQRLKSLLQQAEADTVPPTQIAAELKTQFPDLKEFAFVRAPRAYLDGKPGSVVPTVLLRWNQPPDEPTRKRLVAFIKVRLKVANVHVIDY
jgi:uncharacterized hydrophobic protein (TIGR00271 family)